ncbi:MAG: ABC transporter permease [Gemmobacter sp.]
MRALDRKLVRDLRRIRAQGLAIALVLACGVMVLILATGTQRSLVETRDTYYERNAFADIFAGATRVPRALLGDIAAIRGVRHVEGRIVAAAVLDLPGEPAPAAARVMSLPKVGEPVLNRPLLRAGRLPFPERADEVLLSEPFALANGLLPGARLAAVIDGQRRELVVTGHVLSPEFIYTIGPGALMPDDRRYGLIWMGEAAIAAATDMDGAFNELSLSLMRGTDPAPVIAALDRLLAPYGGTGAHGRDRQVSHACLASELEQLGAMALILPPVFLIVSAFLVNMVLGRLIALERQQIGLLKAFGYSTFAIGWHYLKLCLGIGVAGVILGWLAGWGLGHRMTALYADFFRFPFLIYMPGAWAVVLSGALGMATVVLGALRAVHASVRLAPAVAMQPPAPPVFQRGLVDRLGQVLRLRQTTMMILRSITRWPGRASVTLFGVAASVAVLVASYFTFDAMEVMVDELFVQTNRQHVTLALSQSQGLQTVEDARALPGVLVAEGGYALPVRLRSGSRSRLLPLEARSDGGGLVRVLDAAGNPVAIPPDGLVVPQSLADEMGLAAGDRVLIDLLAPPRETWALTVAGTVRQSLGQQVLMNRDALFARMRTAPQVNRIDLLVDPARMDDLNAAIKRTGAVAGLIDLAEVRAKFADTIAENLLTMGMIYTAIGMLITLGVVYNAARIQLAERAHELASLRVLGFSRAEVGWVLVGEIMLLTAVAVPVGWALGYGFAGLTAQGFSTDVVTIPLVVERRTYALASIAVVVTALGAALVVRRRLDRIDIVTALKARE